MPSCRAVLSVVRLNYFPASASVRHNKICLTREIQLMDPILLLTAGDSENHLSSLPPCDQTTHKHTEDFNKVTLTL